MCNEVAEGQHRSTKHHQAGFLVLNKVLVSDLFRYTRQSGCYGFNDTNGYFDCIQHTFAVLVLMNYGVAWSVAITLFEVLQKARPKIKTGYGVSDPVYSNEETAISVIGQGNGLGPAQWALISSIITPISKHDISLLGFVFVNNTDLVSSTDDVHSTGATMIALFQALMIWLNSGI